MTIKDVENLLHVDRANIRYYEKEGLLITRRNPVNGYRDYSEENVECLNKIIFLRNLGITIGEIRNLQSGNESIKSVLLKHEQNIKEQTEKLKIAKDICNELTNIENLSFNNLKLTDYSFYKEQDNKALLKDTILSLYAIKDIVIPWLLIIISLITAVVSYSLLPEKVATDWYGLVAVEEANRLIVFLIPLVMVGITVFAKAMISNFLYYNMPYYLIFVDKIVGYFSICTAIIMFTYQINIVLFMGGIKINFYSVLFTEILASLGYIMMILLQNKKKVPANNA